jgi:hypothetical protein
MRDRDPLHLAEWLVPAVRGVLTDNVESEPVWSAATSLEPTSERRVKLLGLEEDDLSFVGKDSG